MLFFVEWFIWAAFPPSTPAFFFSASKPKSKQQKRKRAPFKSGCASQWSTILLPNQVTISILKNHHFKKEKSLSKIPRSKAVSLKFSKTNKKLNFWKKFSIWILKQSSNVQQFIKAVSLRLSKTNKKLNFWKKLSIWNFQLSSKIKVFKFVNLHCEYQSSRP